MRIMLDGEFFADGDTLQAMSEVSGLPASRFAFHPDDQKARKRAEIQAAFAEACRRDVGEGSFYEVLGAVLSDQTKRATLAAHLVRLGTLRKQVDGVTTRDPAAVETQLRAVAW